MTTSPPAPSRTRAQQLADHADAQVRALFGRELSADLAQATAERTVSERRHDAGAREVGPIERAGAV